MIDPGRGCEPGTQAALSQINEAMFAEALARGRKLGLLATFPSSVPSMEAELKQLSPTTILKTACVPQALTALQAGNDATHDALLAAVVKCPVLTAPDAAVLRLKSLVS